MRPTLLSHRRGAYGALAAALLLFSWLLFSSQDPSVSRSGSTWQGYTLGGISLGIVIWLTLLGLRKRSYRAAGKVQGWVSAHVYLGIALVGIASFHSAGQLGWNVHSVAYGFMIIVVISGMAGTWMYLVIPRWATDNRKGRTRELMLEELGDLDSESSQTSSVCSPTIELAIQSSLQGTVLGGTWLDQLMARDRSTFMGSENNMEMEATKILNNRDQVAILEFVARLAPGAERIQEANALSELVSLIARRQELLRRIRKDIQLQSWLKAWLLIHIPVSIALLSALVVHVTVVFLYW